ncbi:MAG: hypothetical protein BWX80_04180 [Candidatus Hydrogenedentes bacterium ADurb.Bin101]|nr:MAG: hypothetical protein BWX80_04180 [Candidatus Hydrogenedentes bacterium ADurb.Bin101]
MGYRRGRVAALAKKGGEKGQLIFELRTAIAGIPVDLRIHPGIQGHDRGFGAGFLGKTLLEPDPVPGQFCKRRGGHAMVTIRLEAVGTKGIHQINHDIGSVPGWRIALRLEQARIAP